MILALQYNRYKMKSLNNLLAYFIIACISANNLIFIIASLDLIFGMQNYLSQSAVVVIVLLSFVFELAAFPIAGEVDPTVVTTYKTKKLSTQFAQRKYPKLLFLVTTVKLLLLYFPLLLRFSYVYAKCKNGISLVLKPENEKYFSHSIVLYQKSFINCDGGISQEDLEEHFILKGHCIIKDRESLTYLLMRYGVVNICRSFRYLHDEASMTFGIITCPIILQISKITGVPEKKIDNYIIANHIKFT